MNLVARGSLVAGTSALAGGLLVIGADQLLPLTGGTGSGTTSATPDSLILLACLAVALLGGAACAWLTHRTLRPLVELAGATRAFASGPRSRSRAMRDGDPQVLTALQARADEVGALARSIGDMQQRLEHRNAALTRAYLTVMESERRLTGIIDHLIEGFLVVEADGTIQRANPAAGRLFGYPPDELTGHHVTVLGWKQAELEACASWPDADASAAPAGPLDETLQSVRNRSGDEVPVEVGVTRVEQDGRVLYCVLARDMSLRMRMEHEVRQSRKFLNRVVELMPVAVFLKDAATLEFAMANRAMELLTGLPRESLIGRSYPNFPLFDQAFGKAFTEIERQLAAGVQPMRTVQYGLPTPAGTRTVRATTVGLTDGDGRVTHLLGVIEDLSDQIAVQNELESEKQRAEAANQAKSEFLANMSHELRTPLNAIIGYSEILDEMAREAGREQESADLRRIVGAGRHLLTVINAILDLARSESGRTEASYHPLDVDRLVADVCHVAEPLMRNAGNRLEVHGHRSGSCVSDENMLRAILTNLLGNAAKFTRNGAVSLHYDVGEQGAEFRIRDTGIGIDPELLGRIFQPFVQADLSTTREYGGTGLGLTLCRRYCDQLAGAIEVDSVPGQGSTFTVRIPNARAAADAADPRQLVTRALKHHPPRADGRASLGRDGLFPGS